MTANPVRDATAPAQPPLNSRLGSVVTASGAEGETWWQDAVVYQIYVRSFRDADGDGIGDLAGIRAELASLAELGVDAIWLNPCYASPQRDHGYDIADYFTIDPAYGDVGELESLVTEAHQLGLRVVMDMVANHCSFEHDWFQAALDASPGTPERERFLFRDGRGPRGAEPPNNWQSVFGGPAWTRVIEPNGEPGQWYFHAFDPGQPDFNWRNPEVAAYFEDVLRFWFERGVDGFRIDVAHGHLKHPELPDWPGAEDDTGGYNAAMWDQPEVHDIYRSWRALGDSHPQPKYLVGEVWVPTHDSLAAYCRPDELHQVFNFDLLVQPWAADRLRGAIDGGLAQAQATGSATAWTLSNHDVHRTATRYGQQQDLASPSTSDLIAAARRTGPVDHELGQARARAAAALLLALPGSVYLYQGEELGLPEVFELPDTARQDPIWIRSGGRELGRDGCRVPLPWQAKAEHFGFGPAGSALPWLPQPAWFQQYALDAQLGDPHSTRNIYARLLQHRRVLFGEARSVRWLPSDSPDLLAFTRGSGACVVNAGDHPIKLPATWALGRRVVETGVIDDVQVIPGNCAAWFEFSNNPASPEVASWRPPHPKE